MLCVSIGPNYKPNCRSKTLISTLLAAALLQGRVHTTNRTASVLLSCHHPSLWIRVLKILLAVWVGFKVLGTIEWRPLWLFFKQPHGFDVLGSHISILPPSPGCFPMPTFLLSVVKRWNMPAGRMIRSSFSNLILTHSS